MEWVYSLCMAAIEANWVREGHFYTIFLAQDHCIITRARFETDSFDAKIQKSLVKAFFPSFSANTSSSRKLKLAMMSFASEKKVMQISWLHIECAAS